MPDGSRASSGTGKDRRERGATSAFPTQSSEGDMKIRERFFAVVLMGFAFSLRLYAAVLTGQAQLHPINQSGITGEVHFADTGTHLKVLGVAHGLNPTHSYISLLYGAASVPGGPQACEPDGSLNGPQMVVGFWVVEPDGDGTLTADKSGTGYAPVTNAGTISIRDASAGGALQACGEVAVNH